MATSVNTSPPPTTGHHRARPRSITALAVFSLALGVITGIPQLYYVLFAINQHVFPIGPDANPLGQIWYWYILKGDQAGYLTIDPGTLAGGIEDAFMMAPLYIITAVGLLRLRAWVVPIGLITAAMIFYAILFFVFSGILGTNVSTADFVTVILSSVPYLAYPLWLAPTLLVRNALFTRAGSART